MSTEAQEIGRLLFNETAHQTGITEYGVSWQELAEGRAAIPPQGARFDIAFEGSLRGERIKGDIKGVDYLEIRADGRNQMTIYATITTEDGATIALVEDGVLTLQSEDKAQLHLNLRFSTAHERYTWLNSQQVWARGTVDMTKGEITVRAFIA